MGRRALVVANWKMNGQKARVEALAQALCAGLPPWSSTEVVVCPPFVYLPQLQRVLEGSALGLGAQNLHAEDSGAYTGEVSAPMLREFGCRYVLAGHSERRILCNESDAQVAAKFVAALRNGLVPVLCVGESLAERESGAAETVVVRQLDAVLAVAGPGVFGNAVIAYEPVWAIGSGRAATPEAAQTMHAVLRARLASLDPVAAEQTRILYGGSVNAGNAAEFFVQADVDGALVGGASLVADEFGAICAALERPVK